MPCSNTLAKPEVLPCLANHVEAHGLNNFGRIPSWDAVRVSISPNLPESAGRTIAAMARQKDADPFATALDYIVADRGQTRVLVTSISEDDIATFVASPDVLVGSDSNSVATEGITSQERSHPRFYGTFARILGHYARDLGLLSAEDAIRKMTGATAAALGISDRGVLSPGGRADVTIFDAGEIAERATYKAPHRYPEGISRSSSTAARCLSAHTCGPARPRSWPRGSGESAVRRAYSAASTPSSMPKLRIIFSSRARSAPSSMRSGFLGGPMSRPRMSRPVWATRTWLMSHRNFKSG